MADNVISIKAKKNRKHKNSGLRLLIAVILIAAVLWCLYSFLKRSAPSSSSDNGQVINSIDFSSGIMSDIYTNGKIVYCCRKDGMMCLDENGSELWTDQYSMTDPIMSENGEYVAVADPHGKNFRVYNKNGLVYNIKQFRLCYCCYGKRKHIHSQHL